MLILDLTSFARRDGGWGLSFETTNGKFITATNEKVEICYDSFIEEALALRFGINLARTMVCSKVEINSDDMEVGAALR